MYLCTCIDVHTWRVYIFFSYLSFICNNLSASLCSNHCRKRACCIEIPTGVFNTNLFFGSLIHVYFSIFSWNSSTRNATSSMSNAYVTSNCALKSASPEAKVSEVSTSGNKPSICLRFPSCFFLFFFVCGLLQGMRDPQFIYIYIYTYTERERRKHLFGGTKISYFEWGGGVSFLISTTLSDRAKDSAGGRHKSFGR